MRPSLGLLALWLLGVSSTTALPEGIDKDLSWTIAIEVGNSTTVQPRTIDFIISTQLSLIGLADELVVDLKCLILANPFITVLLPGMKIRVPEECCKGSCYGKVCSQRKTCQASSSTLPLITKSVSSSADIKSSTTTSNSISTISSVPSFFISDCFTCRQPSSSYISTSSQPGDSSVTTTVNSAGVTVISRSGVQVTLPTGLTSATTITSDGQTFTYSPSPEVTTGVNSAGQTFISKSGVQVTLPTGLTSATTITSNGQTFTFQPASEVTSVNSAGVTYLSKDGVQVPVPTGLTTATTITSNGQTFTFSPTGSDATSVNSAGVTFLSKSGVQVSVPTGLTTATTITSGGQTFTFSPTPSDGTSVDSAGVTFLSKSGVQVSVPTGLTTVTTITSNGQTFTFSPTNGPAISSSTTGVIPGVTTVIGGTTIISQSGRSFTIPTGITTVTTITDPAGSVITFTPSPTLQITTVISGTTIISRAGSSITVPTGITTPFILTGPGGTFTFTPTPTSSSRPGGFIVPILTDVSEPKPTDDGSVIPCNLWFFNICLRWGDINIGGWKIIDPPGEYPPGPPPPFSIDPSLGITLSISGTLPPWPKYTIGPDRQPTFDPKPTDGPNNECNTKSAGICATRTSYGVSGTITTTTQVSSTCGTVYGCDVTGSSITTTTGCLTASTVTDIFVSCPPEGTATPSLCQTTSTSLVTGCSVTPTTITCGILTPTGIAADPACNADTHNYVVFPKANVDTGALAARLQGYLPDPSKLQTSTSQSLGVLFWRISLTTAQSIEVSKIAEVAGIKDDCNASACPYDPTIRQVYQDNSAVLGAGFDSRALSYISWKKPAGFNNDPQSSTPINPDPDHYYFDDSAGQGVTVYVVDTGTSLNHPEFEYVRSHRWLYAGPPGTEAENDAGEDLSKHGTTMAGTVYGTNLGVAKKIDAVTVRLTAGDGHVYTPEYWLEGLAKVADDLGAGPAGIRAVVLMATFFSPAGLRLNGIASPEAVAGFETAAWLALSKLVAQGAFLVTGSGNAQVETINGWPANFGKSTQTLLDIPSMIVAGATSFRDQGVIYGSVDFANGLPHLFAPGFGVTVADGTPDTNGGFVGGGYRTSQGTSIAAAHTAGLAAYFISLLRTGSLRGSDGNLVPNDVQSLKNFMVAEAWNKGYDRSHVINGVYNLIDPLAFSCPYRPGQPANKAKFIRQEASSCRGGPTTTFNPPSDLPDLPDRGISTPPGSSCVSTGIQTQCALGPGGQTACATKTACALWTATGVTSSTTTSLAPLQTHDGTCFDAPGPNDPQTDIDAFRVEDYASQFCSVVGGFDLGPSSTPQGGDFGPNAPDNSIHYRYLVDWVPDCRTSVPQQNINNPGGDFHCYDVIQLGYTRCNNKGVGGSVQVGCLRYTFDGRQ